MNTPAEMHKAVLQILEALGNGSDMTLEQARILIDAKENYSALFYDGWNVVDLQGHPITPFAKITEAHLQQAHRTVKWEQEQHDLQRYVRLIPAMQRLSDNRETELLEESELREVCSIVERDGKYMNGGWSLTGEAPPRITGIRNPRDLLRPPIPFITDDGLRRGRMLLREMSRVEPQSNRAQTEEVRNPDAVSDEASRSRRGRSPHDWKLIDRLTWWIGTDPTNVECTRQEIRDKVRNAYNSIVHDPTKQLADKSKQHERRTKPMLDKIFAQKG